MVVSHELSSIFTIADRVIMLDGDAKGIIAAGDPRELRDQHDDPRVHAFFNRQPRVLQTGRRTTRGWRVATEAHKFQVGVFVIVASFIGVGGGHLARRQPLLRADAAVRHLFSASRCRGWSRARR